MRSLSLVIILSFLVFAPLHAESPLDPKGNAKITKNEAEHIALRKYPGARVGTAKLETVHGQLVWSLELVTTNDGTKPVAVDAMTGRLAGAHEKK